MVGMPSTYILKNKYLGGSGFDDRQRLLFNRISSTLPRGYYDSAGQNLHIQ